MEFEVRLGQSILAAGGAGWLDAIENQAIEIEDALHAQLVKQKSRSIS